MSASPLRTLGATAAAFMVAAVALLAYSPAPVAADDSPPVVPGFVPPTVMPPSEVITGVAGTGGVAVVAGAGGAGAAATLGAGGLALAGGLAAFAGTTYVLDARYPCGFKLIEWHLGPNCIADPANFSSEPIQSDIRPCSDMGITGAALAIATNPVTLDGYSPLLCTHLAFSPRPEGGDTWYAVRGRVYSQTGGFGGVNIGSLQFPDDHIITGVYAKSFGVWHPAEEVTSGGTTWWRWEVHADAGYGETQSIVVASRQRYDVGFCAGVYNCSIWPQNFMVLSRRPPTGVATQLATWPANIERATYGMPLRNVAEMRCTDIGTGESTTVTKRGAWYYQSEADEFPIEIPHCPEGGSIIGTHLKVYTEFPLGPLDTLFDLELATSAYPVVQALKTCVSGCLPHVSEGVCIVGGSPAPMTWCDSQAAYNPTGKPGLVEAVPGTYTSPRPLTETPLPPAAPASPPAESPWVSLPKPSEVVEPETQECFPSGWQLFNPVQWVVKPLKCVFKWAFIPTTALETRIQAVMAEVSGTALGTTTDLIYDYATGIQSAMDTAGTSDCQGPGFRPVPQVPTLYPFSSCSEPMSTAASLFRGLVTVATCVVVGVFVYNALTRPFGVAPIRSGGDES